MAVQVVTVSVRNFVVIFSVGYTTVLLYCCSAIYIYTASHRYGKQRERTIWWRSLGGIPSAIRTRSNSRARTALRTAAMRKVNLCMDDTVLYIHTVSYVLIDLHTIPAVVKSVHVFSVLVFAPPRFVRRRLRFILSRN